MASVELAVDFALVVFFCCVFGYIITNPRMLLPKYARAHRILGVTLFFFLALGAWDARRRTILQVGWQLYAYDALLSCLGLAVSYSAAVGFEAAHSKVKNEASGTLDPSATVTFSEMLEHCFYQGINLVQITYLHALQSITSARVRMLIAGAALLPWLARTRFPVNSFSKNYQPGAYSGKHSTRLTRFLYRIKKWQYVFYKHCLLHGLNASLAVAGSGSSLASDRSFRLYWLCLNTAYVHEFFLQTLVKRRYMSQRTMLALQQLLMLVSSVAALRVLAHVKPYLCVLSLALNFTRRGREVSNGVLVLAAGAAVSQLRGAASS